MYPSPHLSCMVIVSFLSTSESLFMFCQWDHLYELIGFTYKGYLMLFVFLWPHSPSMIICYSILVAADGMCSLFFLAEYYFFVCMYPIMFIFLLMHIWVDSISGLALIVLPLKYRWHMSFWVMIISGCKGREGLTDHILVLCVAMLQEGRYRSP